MIPSFSKFTKVVPFSLITLAAVFVFATPAFSAPIELIGAARNFVETGANNSLIKDRTLFKIKKNGVFYTESELVNIHAHYRANQASQFKNYTYTGMMRILESGGGVGVTFYSDYPKSDTYYRLRMFGGGSFHIAPHPDGEYTLEGSTDTGVIPDVELWQKFKIVVRTYRNRTRIRAKVWPKGAAEPANWQVDCIDRGENRIKKGKPGVWSMASGTKQWKKLKVSLLSN